MRRSLATLVLVMALAAAVWPAAAFAGTYVLDEAEVVPAEAEARLEAVSAQVEAATPGAEIAVLTVDSLDGREIEEYAEERFEQLGVGSSATDNGVLILVAVKERRVRIEVGYGLEGALPDAKAGAIVDEALTPRFKEGDFGGGLEAAQQRIASAVAQEYGVTIQGVSNTPAVTVIDDTSWVLYVVLAVFFMIVVVLVSAATRGVRRLFGGDPGGGFFGGNDFGGSDSGGGFGGGDSGGGGASGDW